jgi:hypothetical protein
MRLLKAVIVVFQWVVRWWRQPSSGVSLSFDIHIRVKIQVEVLLQGVGDQLGLHRHGHDDQADAAPRELVTELHNRFDRVRLPSFSAC